MTGISSVDAFSKLTSLVSNQVSALQPDGTKTKGDVMSLARTDPRHFLSGGGMGTVEEEAAPTFEDAMFSAMNGVNADQIDSSNLIESMLTNPDSVDAHDVTIGMAKANMSLSITRTVLSRVVQAWKDVLNTR